MIFWLYGRSAAGKTTLALGLQKSLRSLGISPCLIDGDKLRSGLCNDLGFSDVDRTENHRRAAEAAKIFAEQGDVVIGATMAPRYAQRDIVHAVLGEPPRWIYVDAPAEVCAERDPKGLYARALAGQIDYFDADAFDTPRAHELHLHLRTHHRPVEDSSKTLLCFVLSQLGMPK